MAFLYFILCFLFDFGSWVTWFCVCVCVYYLCLSSWWFSPVSHYFPVSCFSSLFDSCGWPCLVFLTSWVFACSSVYQLLLPPRLKCLFLRFFLLLSFCLPFAFSFSSSHSWAPVHYTCLGFPQVLQSPVTVYTHAQLLIETLNCHRSEFVSERCACPIINRWPVQCVFWVWGSFCGEFTCFLCIFELYLGTALFFVTVFVLKTQTVS